MSDCIHCQIHDLLESHLQNQEVNLADIAFKVTEVLADLILMAHPEDQGRFIADILQNLGQLVLDKNREAGDDARCRSGPVPGDCDAPSQIRLPRLHAGGGSGAGAGTADQGLA